LNPEVQAARQRVADAQHDPAAHYGLAQAFDRAGDPAAAIASLDVALRLAPAFAEAHNLKGILLAGRGETERAIESFGRAIDARPGYARAHNNLGNSLRTLGRIDEAERAIAEAVRLQPDYQLAQHNLGAIRQARGKSDDAVAALNASLALNPQFRPSWIALAAAERQRGNAEQAIAAYQQAINLAPSQSSDERVGLAETLDECGFHDAAQQAYAAALQVKPDHLAAALGLHLGLPQVYADNNAIDVARAHFASGLNALERDFSRLHAGLDRDAALDAWRWSNFFLAYQGRDDRELQRRYARLVANAIDAKAPELRAPVAPMRHRPGDRIRIGFVSGFLTDGTVGNYFLRWITELDRNVFEVFVYQLAPRADALTHKIRVRADRLVEPLGAAASIGPLARTIRADALDVLVYPEVGMDARCVVLAAMRLATVQCAGWGHPVTTGHQTIDYFLSVDAMEPADADAHYVERLIRLPGLGTAYPRPALRADSITEARATLRARLRIPAESPVFLCSQSLFKVLPDDDALFARVLAAAPGSMLLLFEGPHREVSAQTLQRLGKAMAARAM
jgi:predicted O-linked N-acetylglucosamine transferase (SPINDLY family)